MVVMSAVGVGRMLYSVVVRVLWQWGGCSASDEKGSGSKFRAGLAGLVAGLLSAAAVAGSGGSHGDALAVIDEHCRANGGSSEQCACEREAFGEEVLSRASSPAIGMFAAHIHTGDEMAMMQAVQSMESGALQEAGILASTAGPALEACAERTTAEPSHGDLPEGDDPRSRFIRQCAADNDRPDICGCIADKALERLSPHELELLVDMRAAEDRGEEPVEAMAEERGLTEEEAKEGLAASTQQIAGAMMAINPMECASP